MKKHSRLDLSGGVVQDKPQAVCFRRATLADPATDPEYAERSEKSPVEPQAEDIQEAAKQAVDLRSRQAGNIVKKHLIVVMGTALVPIPLFDLVAVSGVQLKMLYSLTRLYEVPFSKNLGKSSIASLLGGVMPTSTAMTLASLAKAVPGLGTATGMISVSLLGGATTYAIGSVFVQYFESGGTLLDFEPKKMRACFSSKLEEGKGIAAGLKSGETQTSG